MKKSDFHYDLPEELIAQKPLETRSASWLLCLDGLSGKLEDRRFTNLPELLKENDLLVFNDTKVIPARLYGRKESGGKVEILIERLLENKRALAHVRASKSPKPDTLIVLDGGPACRVDGREGDLFVLDFLCEEPLESLLERQGHMPLPPYIARPDEADDRARYQTVYARTPGAVAAPTAGLHFDKFLLGEIRKKGIETAFVTLHVGSGTFQPVRTENLSEHKMHTEYFEVSEAVVKAVCRTREKGGRVAAVGTTAVRALESASQTGDLQPYQGETRLFITPGYRFVAVDALVTNFHLPESTLLMLVCAFAGYENAMAAYRHAVEEKYRFFSYGDAMFIEGKNASR